MQSGATLRLLLGLLSAAGVLGVQAQAAPNCKPGSYKTQNACRLCEPGKYQPHSNRVYCDDCPDGKTNRGAAVDCTAPTSQPTLSPTPTPSMSPSVAPTPVPSDAPTGSPTLFPSPSPTNQPTSSPTARPTPSP
jgi:hypothetical protein